MKKSPIFLLVLLPAICLASESEWFPTGKYSINMKLITKHDGKVQAWIKTDGICGDAKCEGFLQIETICNESKFRPLQSLVYNKKTQKMIENQESQDSEFRPAAPDDDTVQMVKIICKSAN